MFDVKQKVALITGGASGIGLQVAKELLKNGLRGVVLADINSGFGDAALKEISREYGSGKAIFKQTDVTNKDQLEDAFKAAVQHFKQLDILINNAGVLNDSIWEKQIDINCKALVQGTLLAVENYLPKYRSGEEGVVVNFASCAALDSFTAIPVYCASKGFVAEFSRAIGHEDHYKRTKVKVVAVCPGATDTPLLQLRGKTLGPAYEKLLEPIFEMEMQSTQFLAQEVVSVIKKGKTSSVWLIEYEPAAEVEYKSRFERLKK